MKKTYTFACLKRNEETEIIKKIMIEKMKQCKFLLMLLLLFIGMGAYAQNVADSKNIFTETFDKMKGKGGNDGNFIDLSVPAE